MTKGLVFALLMTLAAPSEVTVDVYPNVVMAGGNVRWRCRVQKHPDNRKLRGGFEFYRTFEETMDGDSARITYERVFLEVPCNPGAAFCEVTRASGKRLRVVSPFNVAGCE